MEIRLPNTCISELLKMTKSNLTKAFNIQDFRKEGHQLIDMLADYLEDMRKVTPANKVYNYMTPNELYEKWELDFASGPHEEYQPFFESLIREIVHMHHPRYLGHQKSFVAPASVLAETMGGLLDPGMGIFEQGSTAVVLEKLLSKNDGEADRNGAMTVVVL